jgi:hypothetical protein
MQFLGDRRKLKLAEALGIPVEILWGKGACRYWVRRAEGARRIASQKKNAWIRRMRPLGKRP